MNNLVGQSFKCFKLKSKLYKKIKVRIITLPNYCDDEFNYSRTKWTPQYLCLRTTIQIQYWFKIAQQQLLCTINLQKLDCFSVSVSSFLELSHNLGFSCDD